MGRLSSPPDVLSDAWLSDHVACTCRVECGRPAVQRAVTTCQKQREVAVFYCAACWNALMSGLMACRPCRQPKGVSLLTAHVRELKEKL